jgi:hypothetical protein
MPISRKKGIRPPTDGGPDVQRFAREVREAIEALQARNVEMNGRRIVGTSRPVDPGDYANKAYVDALVKGALSHVDQKLVKIRTRLGGPTSTGGGTPSGPVLPAPNHNMDFGYYKVVHRNKAGEYEQDFLDEVKGFTNLTYIGGSDFGISTSTAGERKAGMTDGIRHVAQDSSLRMMLDFEFHTGTLTINDVIDAAQAHWDRIAYVVAGDELDGTAAEMNEKLQLIKSAIESRSLNVPPMGATFAPATTLVTDAIFAPLLDFVNIEAYSRDPANHGTSQQNIDAITATVNQMKARVPTNKQLGMIFQAYDRNGAFGPIVPDLTELQAATYGMCAQDQRVFAMLLFAYGRPDGSKANPELIPYHKAIWTALGGGGAGGATQCGQGRPCCGGVGNPANCPRWCDGGDYATFVDDAIRAYITIAPPGVFSTLTPPTLVDEAAGAVFVAGTVAALNTAQPGLTSVPDPDDGKEIIVKKKVGAVFSENYAIWASDFRVRFNPGSYRATCYPADF